MNRMVFVCLAAASCAAVACGSGNDDAAPPPADSGSAGATASAGAAGADAAGASGQGGAPGQGSAGQAGAAGQASAGAGSTTVFASEVVSFKPGEGAGYGQDKMPDVVLGKPNGGGSLQGSLDVVSLGGGGEIVLAFGDADIVDREGPDFIVFENAFWAGGDENNIWKELGEVSVSEDGVTWKTFPCDAATFEKSSCAGWHVVWATPSTTVPYDAAKVGGDAFDLAAIGVSKARYVRVRDVTGQVAPPNAGFDLDALAVLHASVER